jgi:hypothetical protein
MINQNVKTDFIYPFKGLIISIVILFFSFSLSLAQKPGKETPPFKERLFFGGSFALQLGTLTNIELSPVAGLWVLPRMAVAVGPTYRYYKYMNDKTSVFGGKTYVQYIFFRDMDRIIPLGIHTSLFMHLEDEMLSLESEFFYNVDLKPKRFVTNTVLAGGGISQQIGEKASLNIIILWALNNPVLDYDIYSNPEIRISFVF